jgi:hypothetical protein
MNIPEKLATLGTQDTRRRKTNTTQYALDKKGCTRLAAASDKDYQLFAHGRWFTPGTLPPLVAMI